MPFTGGLVRKLKCALADALRARRYVDAARVYSEIVAPILASRLLVALCFMNAHRPSKGMTLFDRWYIETQDPDLDEHTCIMNEGIRALLDGAWHGQPNLARMRATIAIKALGVFVHWREMRELMNSSAAQRLGCDGRDKCARDNFLEV